MIKKSEIASLIIAKRVSELEEKIDEKLKTEYVDGKKTIIVINRKPENDVWAEIERKYKESGWDIKMREEKKEIKGSPGGPYRHDWIHFTYEIEIS